MPDYDEQVAEVLRQLENQGIEKIIAFSGSVFSPELEERAERIVAESFEVFSGLPIAIQTGGTHFDIQKYAAQRATDLGMPLIGIYPAKGAKYLLKNLDFAIQVEPRYGESEWGDDTEVFAKLPHGVELIGGSLGTLIEFAHIMKINDGRIKQGNSPVYIAPVKLDGARLVANVAYDFPLKQGLRELMPQSPITEDGRTAAEFLVDKLGLK